MVLVFKTHQQIRDPEWPVTGISTPLIGGEPQEQGVKIRIYANYDGNYGSPIFAGNVGNCRQRFVAVF